MDDLGEIFDSAATSLSAYLGILFTFVGLFGLLVFLTDLEFHEFKPFGGLLILGVGLLVFSSYMIDPPKRKLFIGILSSGLGLFTFLATVPFPLLVFLIHHSLDSFLEMLPVMVLGLIFSGVLIFIGALTIISYD